MNETVKGYWDGDESGQEIDRMNRAQSRCNWLF